MKLTQTLLKKIIKEELDRIVEEKNNKIGEWNVEVYVNKAGNKQIYANAPSKDGSSFGRKIAISNGQISTNNSISVSIEDMKAIMDFWEQNR